MFWGKLWKLLCTCEESTGCSLSTDLWRQPPVWRYWNMAWPNSQFDVWIFFFWDCFSTLPDSPNDQDPLMDCQWWWGRTWLWPGRWKPSLTRWPLHQPEEEWELLDSPAIGMCFWIRWIGNSPCRAWWELSCYSILCRSGSSPLREFLGKYLSSSHWKVVDNKHFCKY